MECVSPFLLCILVQANVIVTNVQGEGNQTMLCVSCRPPPSKRLMAPGRLTWLGCMDVIVFLSRKNSSCLQDGLLSDWIERQCNFLLENYSSSEPSEPLNEHLALSSFLP